MPRHNTGAFISHTRPASKAALRRALAGEPENVWFDATSGISPGAGNWRPEDITEDVILDVVGPDPYTRRNWYATVTRKNGKLTVT